MLELECGDDAQGLKQEAHDRLAALLPTGDDRSDKLIGKAIVQLEKAL